MATDAQPDPAAVTKPKRWSFQYSISTLLVVVTVAGVTLGVIGWRAEQQRQAVAALESAGAHVGYERDTNGLPDSLSNRVRETWLPKDFWESVVDVGIGAGGDGVLAHVGGLPTLESLSACSSGVTDAGMIQVGRLSELRILILGYTEITDDGLAQLAGLRQLESLDLSETRVTDRGLAHLRSLNSLRYLTLDGTRVTDAGVAELQNALPNCVIHH